MRINTNIASLTAQRALANTTRAFARALERLSSGKRINRAGDDAAGLAISERLQSEVRGLTRTAKNVNEAFGMLATADGALSAQVDLVQRMRELAIQSANGTVSVTERQHLDTEFQTLLAEYERIANSSQFNGVNLLDGSLGTQSLQVGTQKGQSIEFSLNSTRMSEAMPNETAVSTEIGTGTFTAGTTVSIGSAPRGIRTGDVNNDGILDLVTSNQNTNNVSIRLGVGDGTFTTATTLTVGSAPRDVHLCDFNNDGNLDLAAANLSSNNVSIYLGDGAGNFVAGTTVAGGTTNVSAIGTGDFNADGYQDILVAASADNLVGVRLGDGTGQFSTGTTVALTGANSPCSISVGDINNDNKLDFVTANNGNASASVVLGDGAGGFAAPSVVSGMGGTPRYVTLVDINEDNHLDMLVANESGGQVAVRMGTGSGAFTVGTTLTVGSGAFWIASGDFDGDGHIDIGVANLGTDNVSILHGDGLGAFSVGTTVNVGDQPMGIVTGDFTGDGVLDLAVTNANASAASILIGDSTTSTTGVSIDLDITTQSNAQDILELLDTGLDYLSAQRARIGAVGNRLESALSSILLTQENLSAARSQIIDADMAEETAELTRAQILQQAGVSVLGQANTSLQMVLGLLRF